MCFTNDSWHWDGEELAGNPLGFVIRGLEAAVPLHSDRAELLTEAILQYGNVPGGSSRLPEPGPGEDKSSSLRRRRP